MRLHPMHPAAWVLDELADAGWQVESLLAFTRASTLVLAHRNQTPSVVVKAGFGSNHVLAAMPVHDRPAAYGFYWYQQMTPTERSLARRDFTHEIMLTRLASGTGKVVPLIEEGACSEFDWYTMPYYPHGNLRSLMTSTETSIAEYLTILVDVAYGLIELHRRGIVHRDVYQENILIDHGRGLITDLGAARQISTPRGPQRRGPEVHWPPEYATNYAEAGPAADVFSLAVLAYRILEGDIPRLNPSLHRYGGVLGDHIVAALSHNPLERPTMAEFHSVLRISVDLLAPADSARHP